MAPRRAVVSGLLAAAVAVALTFAVAAAAVEADHGATDVELAEVDAEFELDAETGAEFEDAVAEDAEGDAEDDAETDAEGEAEAEAEDEFDSESELESASEVELAAGATAAANPPAVFLIRHGEKPYPDNKELSPRGAARAKGLVKHFAALEKQYKVKIGGVYAQRSALDVPGRKGPTSKRPVDTVVPLAKALKLAGGVAKYWPEDYPKMVADILKAGKTAVICWEHDALTDVGKAFGVKLVWPEGRYDVTYVLQWVGGKPTLRTTFQNLLPGDVNAEGPVPPSVFIVPCDHEGGKKSDAKTTADQSKWAQWFGGSYALQHGAVRTVVAQKGCQSEVAGVAKYLEAKMVDKLDKPKDVTAAVEKAKRENGVVLVVAERNDIGKIVKQLGAAEKAYPATGADTTYHLLYARHGAPPTFKAVKHA